MNHFLAVKFLMFVLRFDSLRRCWKYNRYISGESYFLGLRAAIAQLSDKLFLIHMVANSDEIKMSSI